MNTQQKDYKLRGGKLERASFTPTSEAVMKKRIADILKLQPHLDANLIRKSIEREAQAEVWVNSFYQVAVYRGNEADELVHVPELKGRCTWLSIKRRDKKPVNSWQDFQTIKNVLVSEGCDAMQIYPAEKRLVNTANQYHLICLPEDTALPFGWEGRLVVTASGTTAGGARQNYSGS